MIQEMHERLKKANERRNCGADDEIASLRAALAAKDAEIERLRKALVDIGRGACIAERDMSGTCFDPQPWNGKPKPKDTWCYRCIARAALGEAELLEVFKANKPAEAVRLARKLIEEEMR